jgi:acyl-CoA hydrolase
VATFVVGDVSAGFTASTNGRITYTGQTSRHIANAIVTLDVSSGSNHKLSVYIAKNGTVASTKMTDTVSAGAPRAIATFFSGTLNQNDYLEIFVRNESTTDSVIAVNAVLSVL